MLSGDLPSDLQKQVWAIIVSSVGLRAFHSLTAPGRLLGLGSRSHPCSPGRHFSPRGDFCAGTRRQTNSTQLASSV